MSQASEPDILDQITSHIMGDEKPDIDHAPVPVPETLADEISRLQKKQAKAERKRGKEPEVLTDDFATPKRGRPRKGALTIPMTIDDYPEGLRPATIQYFRNIFTVEELVIALDRWEYYYQELREVLNDSSDYDDLVELIIAYIDEYRIQKGKKENEALQNNEMVDRIMHRVHLRIQALKGALSARRKDRLNNPGTGIDGFIQLLEKRAAQKNSGDSEWEERLRKMELEENLHLKEKRDGVTVSD